ncbi:MAG: type II toxin-antitoxin system prevent-host-death family antitoxin [Thermoanaerobacteraceae bacterium]|nr:type II toxin-antitoxin system prevent-host-death family antitoxin [Thermoanaerobacteraceae bacterium]
MIVNATEFKTRAGKYLEIVEKEEIIITKNGKEVAKLVPIIKNGTQNADFLYGLLSDFENKDITKKQIRDERINKKYENID